ncbi:MAG: hypothetical protein EOP48_26020 [Sphingobacteriales bacterium]|nr:MAG: hypothetical protein EOP48_26020 [Sphingobacteriales bacterium]
MAVSYADSSSYCGAEAFYNGGTYKGESNVSNTERSEFGVLLDKGGDFEFESIGSVGDSTDDIIGNKVFGVSFGTGFGSVIGSSGDWVESHGLFIIKLDLKSIRKFPVIEDEHMD